MSVQVQAVPIADPRWETTFPHRVAPRAQEWLAGVILRCDEANGWESGATIRHLLQATQTPVPKEVTRSNKATEIRPSVLHSPTYHPPT